MSRFKLTGPEQERVMLLEEIERSTIIDKIVETEVFCVE
jgi:hypothetical protein